MPNRWIQTVQTVQNKLSDPTLMLDLLYKLIPYTIEEESRSAHKENTPSKRHTDYHKIFPLFLVAAFKKSFQKRKNSEFESESEIKIVTAHPSNFSSIDLSEEEIKDFEAIISNIDPILTSEQHAEIRLKKTTDDTYYIYGLNKDIIECHSFDEVKEILSIYDKFKKSEDNLDKILKKYYLSKDFFEQHCEALNSFGIDYNDPKKLESFLKEIREDYHLTAKDALIFAKFCYDNNYLIIFRSVNADTPGHMEQGAIGKGSNLKGKSAISGPLAGLVPVNIFLSKKSYEWQTTSDDAKKQILRSKMDQYQAINDSQLKEHKAFYEEITKLIDSEKKPGEILDKIHQLDKAHLKEANYSNPINEKTTLDEIADELNKRLLIAEETLKDNNGNPILSFINKDGLPIYHENEPIYAIKKGEDYQFFAGKTLSTDPKLTQKLQQAISDSSAQETTVFKYRQFEAKDGKLIESLKNITADYDPLVMVAARNLHERMNEVKQNSQNRIGNKLSTEKIAQKIFNLEKKRNFEHVNSRDFRKTTSQFSREGLRLELNEYEQTVQSILYDLTGGNTSHGPENTNLSPEAFVKEIYPSISPKKGLIGLKSEDEIIQFINASIKEGYPIPINPRWEWTRDDETNELRRLNPNESQRVLEADEAVLKTQKNVNKLSTSLEIPEKETIDNFFDSLERLQDIFDKIQNKQCIDPEIAFKINELPSGSPFEKEKKFLAKILKDYSDNNKNIVNPEEHAPMQLKNYQQIKKINQYSTQLNSENLPKILKEKKPTGNSNYLEAKKDLHFKQCVQKLEVKRQLIQTEAPIIYQKQEGFNHEDKKIVEQIQTLDQKDKTNRMNVIDKSIQTLESISKKSSQSRYQFFGKSRISSKHSQKEQDPAYENSSSSPSQSPK